MMEGIATGSSLKSICAEPDMPTMMTVFNRLSVDAAFALAYTRAREEQADTLADEILEIADNKADDPDANSRRLRADVRKWYAGKLKPRKYGESSQVTLQGPDGGPVKNEVTVRFVDGEVQ